MSYNKGPVKTVTITDADAVRLINLQAAEERRSAANTAAKVVIEALDPQGRKKHPAGQGSGDLDS